MTKPASFGAPVVSLLAASLALAAGLQLLRGLLTGMTVYLRQVHDVPPALLAILLFAIVAAAFAAPLLRRAFGAAHAFLALAAILTLLRCAQQFTADLDARLLIEALGVVGWLWFIPLSFAVRSGGPPADGQPPAALALLLGFTLDTALKGAFLTLDPAAAPGLAPQLTTIALTAAQAAALLWLACRRSAFSVAPEPQRFRLIAVGPAIALQLLIFQNLAHHAALIGWPLPAVFAWTTLANLLAAALLLYQPGWASRPIIWLWPVLVLIFCISSFEQQPPWQAALAALLGPAAIAAALQGAWQGAWQGASGGSASISIKFARLARAAAPLGLPVGLFLMPVLLVGWYARYEISFPISQSALIWGAVLLVAFGISPGAVAQHQNCRGRPAALALVGLLFALPLFQTLSWKSPEPAPVSEPLTVMTYNIHQGFDLYGRHDLEGVAQLIEAEGAQIVALQEVPRGWVVNGSVDALSWLAQRLRMHAAWGPAADPNWGNAILSRYPIDAAEHRPMPNNDALRLNRSYLVAAVDLGARRLQVVATHLHHIGRDAHHRLPQIRELLEQIDWRQASILLGDLNAQPHHEELRRLQAAGLTSVQPPVPTYPADRPRRQIDYVLTTPHFEMINVYAPPTTTSDHRPLAAVLEWAAAE